MRTILEYGLLLRVVSGACLLVGCQNLPSEPTNPFQLEREWGTATGRTAVEAQQLVQAVEEGLPVVRELPGFIARPLRVHMVAELPIRVDGLTVNFDNGDGFVLIVGGEPDLLRIVVHELMHFYFNASNKRFPQMVEEGFCDSIANRVSGDEERGQALSTLAALRYASQYSLKVEGGSSRKLSKLFCSAAPSIKESLQLGSLDYLNLDTSEKTMVTGLGWTFVEVVGYERLVEEADRLEAEGIAAVSPERILALAELDPEDPESIDRMFRLALGGDPGGVLNITLTGH